MNSPHLNRRFLSPVACRIARLDRQRLNEHVSAGDYPAAPDEFRGKTRVFRYHDLVGLHVFGVLLEWALPAKRAGRIVYKLVGAMEAHPEEDAFVLRMATHGLEEIVPASKSKPDASFLGPLSLQLSMTLHVANYRAAVDKAIEAEDLYSGESDNDA